MQRIGVNGPLHFPEDYVLFADKIYQNRHPTVTLFTTQQINRKPEHMRDRSILIRLYYWAGALAYWTHTFVLVYAHRVSRFSKFLMNWAHTFFSDKLCKTKFK